MMAGSFSNTTWKHFLKKSSLAQTVGLSIDSAFLGQSIDHLGLSWLSSFHKVRGYEIFILLKQRASSVYQKMDNIIYASVLWSVLIFLLAVPLALFAAKSVTTQLIRVIDGTRQIALGNFDLRIDSQSKDEVGILVNAVNWMAKKIHDLLQKEKERVRFEHELKTAQTVQDAFYSEKNYENMGITISGSHKPSSECCGDWWGHIKVAEGVEQVMIADATGHGAPAAMLTAMAYTATAMIKNLSTEGQRVSPAEVLRLLNELFCKTLDGSILMTFQIIEFDMNKRQLTIADAGHCHPYIAKGKVEAGGIIRDGMFKILKKRPDQQPQVLSAWTSQPSLPIPYIP